MAHGYHGRVEFDAAKREMLASQHESDSVPDGRLRYVAGIEASGHLKTAGAQRHGRRQVKSCKPDRSVRMQTAMWLMQKPMFQAEMFVGPVRSQHKNQPLTFGGKPTSKQFPAATPRSRMEKVVLPSGPGADLAQALSQLRRCRGLWDQHVLLRQWMT